VVGCARLASLAVLADQHQEGERDEVENQLVQRAAFTASSDVRRRQEDRCAVR
jgi:hypothetical protein